MSIIVLNCRINELFYFLGYLFKKHETGMNRVVHKDRQKYALLETDEHKMYVENNSKLSKSAKHFD